jgi:serine/threonine-protein kinase
MKEKHREADRATSTEHEGHPDTLPALETGGALRSPLFEDLAASADGLQATDLTPGQDLGRFEVEECLGRGGMGEVFAARDKELGRRVALKSLRPRGGIAWSPESQLRFRREAKILSRLDHPNVCRIYDLYEHQGSAFLVLELVPGEAIDVAAAGLPHKERLRLASELAAGIVHAHLHGILHRDLKPANIRVTQDEHVKILDFGISRAFDLSQQAGEGVASVSPELGEGERDGSEEDLSAPLTHDGTGLGTPAYMSPEQKRGEAPGSPSDLYALGLVLLEVFGGDRRDGSRAAQRLRGPRALRLLVADLLAEQPVDRPTAPQAWSRLERIRRAPRRRWLAAAAAGLLIASLGAAVKYTVDIGRERKAALRSLREATEVTDFLISVFDVADPGQSLGEEITARDLLDRGSERIASELKAEPLARARLESALGKIYANLGLFDPAEQHLRVSLELLEEQLPASDPRIAQGRVQLARVALERGHYDEVVETLDRALDAADLDEDPELHASLLEVQAMALRRSMRLQEAEAKIDEALALVASIPGLERMRADSTSAKGMILLNLEQPGESLPWLEESLRLMLKVLPSNHPDVAMAHNNLALAYRGLENYDLASEHFDRALDINRQVLGVEHPGYALALDNLALIRASMDDLEGAETLMREAISIFRNTFGELHPDVEVATGNLSVLLRKQGRFIEARDQGLHALRSAEQRAGPESADTVYYLRAVAQAEIEAGAQAAALPYLERAWPILERFPDSSPRVIALVASTLVNCLVAVDRASEARARCPAAKKLLVARGASEEHLETLDAACSS